jgi:hypothetical protein
MASSIEPRVDSTEMSGTLLWEQEQLAGRAQKDLERREWLRDFVLLLVLIVFSVTVATVLAKWIPD